MSSPSSRLALGLAMMIFCSCTALQVPLSLATPPSTSAVTPPSIQPLEPASTGDDLFLAAETPGALAPAPNASRSRFVKLNLSLLMDEQGRARRLPPGAEISLNLFPDVNYVGVIDDVQEEGGGLSWVGRLKDVEYSQIYMVYTAGVFIGHFASPEGVYEVSIVRSDLYQIIEVDQSGLEGGEEPTD